MSGIVLTEDDFEREVLRSKLPVLVDFYADWCGPCRMLSPILDEIEEEFAQKLRVIRVNTDRQPGFAAKYGVSALPTVIAFRGGKRTAVSVGYKTKQQILALLK